MNDIVRTSDKDWLAKALIFYTNKKAFTFEDDAGLKLTQKDLKSALSLIRSAKSKGSISRQIIPALTGIGITGAGVWLVLAAIADPEPTTKLGLLVTGGLVLALTGSLGTLAALGIRVRVEGESKDGTHRFKVNTEKNSDS